MTKRLYESDVEQISEWNKRLKTLLREADEKQGMEKDEEKDGDDIGQAEDGEDIEKYAEKFKSTGSDLGAGLYGLVAYNDLDAIWDGSANPSINSKLNGLLNSLADALTIKWNGDSWYLGGNGTKKVIDDRLFILAILDDDKKKLYKFIANGRSGNITVPGFIDASKKNVIENLKSTAQEWLDSIPQNALKDKILSPDEYSKKIDSSAGKKWKTAENNLLNIATNKEYSEPGNDSLTNTLAFSNLYREPDPEDEYTEELDKLISILMKAGWDTKKPKIAAAKKRFDELVKLRGEKQEGVGREKR